MDGNGEGGRWSCFVEQKLRRGVAAAAEQPVVAAGTAFFRRPQRVSLTFDVPILHAVAEADNEADNMQDRAKAAGGEIFCLVVLEPLVFRDAVLALEEGHVRRVDTSHVFSMRAETTTETDSMSVTTSAERAHEKEGEKISGAATIQEKRRRGICWSTQTSA